MFLMIGSIGSITCFSNGRNLFVNEIPLSKMATHCYCLYTNIGVDGWFYETSSDQLVYVCGLRGHPVIGSTRRKSAWKLRAHSAGVRGSHQRRLEYVPAVTWRADRTWQIDGRAPRRARIPRSSLPRGHYYSAVVADGYLKSGMSNTRFCKRRKAALPFLYSGEDPGESFIAAGGVERFHANSWSTTSRNVCQIRHPVERFVGGS